MSNDARERGVAGSRAFVMEWSVSVASVNAAAISTSRGQHSKTACAIRPRRFWIRSAKKRSVAACVRFHTGDDWTCYGRAWPRMLRDVGMTHEIFDVGCVIAGQRVTPRRHVDLLVPKLVEQPRALLMYFQPIRRKARPCVFFDRSKP